ncbi:unnamed protein product [Dibothriocephalus latus]|uniref:Miro domain-containing protein n=1 Tax=Dibothriocephalus latus TaxID=60516 RepID=A0A3P7P255_DIBLA|nr:unnamed protein product [Dibothriocephalus latus]
MSVVVRRKVIVVGDANCGKAGLLRVFVHGCFPEVSTGMSFEECHTSLNVVYLTLWNTSGQEDYHNLRPVSYLDADVCIVCFSIGSHDSLESASERWEKEVRLVILLRQHGMYFPVSRTLCS